MGDSSYTLIDDNGVEFFLSPKDKKKRRLNGDADNFKKSVTSNSNMVSLKVELFASVP